MIEDTGVQEKEETAAESLSTRRSSSCSSSSGSGGGGDVELGGEVVGWSSYDDDAEQRLLWETKIVVRICLFEGDNGSIDQVPDVYVSVSRHEYLYQTVFEKVIPLWRHVLPSSASRTPWLECGMLPLKWDLPCGVLHDLHCGGNDDGCSSNSIWTVVAHFSNFPSTILTPFDVKESLRNHVFHSMKEASHVRMGSASRIMNMSHAAQDALWHAIRQGSYDEYVKVYSTLGFESHDGILAAVERVPVRIIVCRGAALKMNTSYEDVYISSRSMNDGSVKDCVYDIARAWMMMKKHKTIAVKNEESGMTGVQIQVGGIDMHGTEPLSYLWRTMHAPDGFLYIYVY
ncbi:hypothetical protein M9434_004551 [Picochlorum sp. BPE23]|nr:hypothetical protein M9434_004551 [Picochlorum sp. BPE23]